MTSYVLTLIGDVPSMPLETVHIDRVWQRLDTAGKTDWLSASEACDLFLDSPLQPLEITTLAREALAGLSIDTVCTPAEARRKKLLISDMDSTIINQECINELGDAMGIGSQISEITAAVINGDISFSDALRKRLALMKGMERRVLKRVYAERITLQSGARTLVQTMRHHQAFCILVSGGFSFFTRRIAERLGFHDHQANTLAFAADRLTGEVLEPILGRSAKQHTLARLCNEQNLGDRDVLAVGDGANDIDMIKSAGLGVAYHGSDSLKKNANACIEFGDLTALLYIQGFHKSEFVLSDLAN